MDRLKELIAINDMSMRLSRQWVNEWNKHNELSVSQAGILELLITEGPKQGKDFVELLNITSGGITGICDKMIASNYIQRVRNNELDRRAVFFEITEHGKEVYNKMIEKRLLLIEQQFSEFSDEDIEIYSSLLKKLIRGMVKM